jgi:hypothetical protein
MRIFTGLTFRYAMACAGALCIACAAQAQPVQVPWELEVAAIRAELEAAVAQSQELMQAARRSLDALDNPVEGLRL